MKRSPSEDAPRKPDMSGPAPSARHSRRTQAVRMADDVGADFILPVHHRTFALSSEPVAEPMERLLGAAGEDRICLREIGGEFHWAPNFSEAGMPVR